MKNIAGPEHVDWSSKTKGNLFTLAAISLLVGVVTGTVCGIFRILLDDANIWRNDLLRWLHDWQWVGMLGAAVIFGTTVAVAAWLVRRYSPYASGSGIPHVEAVLHGECPPAPLQLVPVKFVGGLLAIGSGLALGREGPSVQMGACISHAIGKAFGRDSQECRLLLAAGGGAGLAVAFNAPMAGAAFVLEELMRRFDTRTTIVTFGASAGAIAISRVLQGNAPDFQVAPLPYAGFGCLAISLVLGAAIGLFGVAYNQAILRALAAANGLSAWPVEARAAAVGVGVGLLAWFMPNLVGDGDLLTQQALSGVGGGGLLIAIFLLRFGLGPVSYAAGTPGGLFAPMLVLGAQSGLLFGNFFRWWMPSLMIDPIVYAIVGMAAFFTAVVRAPLTGMILIVELTGSYTQLLPMLGACFAAMLVPTLLANPAIYDSLKVKAK